jgi:hypothetical protein
MKYRFVFFRIVQAQPTGNVWEFENEWNSSVCSCCYDVGNCMKEKIDQNEIVKRFVFFS